jgi:hypothetical protein
VAALTISENDGIAVYSVGSTPSTGPFAIDFPYFLTSEITVKKTVSGVETTLVSGTDYNISGTAADDGYSSGSVTLVASVSSCTITIERALQATKATNFAVAGPLQIKTLNTFFSRLFSFVQDLRRKDALSVRVPSSDYGLDLEASSVATRKGKVLAWHATTGALIESTSTLSEIESGATDAQASADDAAASALAAAASETAAASSASAASSSASAAAASAVDAAASAGALDPANNINWTGTDTALAGSKWTFKDPTDPTKQLQFDVSGVSAGQTSVLTVPDEDTVLAGRSYVTDRIYQAGFTVTRYTSGSGTYTVPANVKSLHVRMVGAGGGGGGTNSSNANSNGVDGGDTTFGSWEAKGGDGYPNSTNGASGGTGGASGTGTLLQRTDGNGACPNHGGTVYGSSAGAPGPWGGAGTGGNTTSGGNGAANSGAGGGGAGTNSTSGLNPGGGGAGEYVEFLITSPAASYSYAVGAGGAGGGGGLNGGTGGSGVIIIEERYS